MSYRLRTSVTDSRESQRDLIEMRGSRTRHTFRFFVSEYRSACLGCQDERPYMRVVSFWLSAFSFLTAHDLCGQNDTFLKNTPSRKKAFSGPSNRGMNRLSHEIGLDLEAKHMGELEEQNLDHALRTFISIEYYLLDKCSIFEH